MKEHNSKENTSSRPAARRAFCRAALVAVLALAAAGGRADQVAMQNGDRYTGSVLSLSAESVVVQSELLGKVTLPRSKVTFIGFGTNVPASFARPATPVPARFNAGAAASTNAAPDASSALRSLGAHTDLIQQVREQYLGAAGIEANRKYDEMLNGLMSGKLTLDDLRAQARSAADQLRAFKRELGGDDAGELDSDLTILEKFVKETAPPQGSVAAPGPRPGPAPSKNESETR
jgi:hypothetical protein